MIKKKNKVRHDNPHLDCDAIKEISHNAKIVDIAKACLASEPILWHTMLYWSLPEVKQSHRYHQIKPEGFHYDMHDYKSLTLFFYLTDVDKESTPHIFIEKIHKEKV